MTSSSLAVVLLCAAAFFFFAAAAHGKSSDDGHRHIHGEDLVAKTCSNVMSHDWGWFPGDNFCESTLRLDKRRSAAARHPRDLALVAMDLAQRAVADADAKVDGVLRRRSGGGTSGGHRHSSNDTARLLRYCRLDYAAVSSTIPVCRAMLDVDDYKPGGAKRDQHQLAAPGDHFECTRRLRRDTFSCWFRIVFGDAELSRLVLKEVEEAWLRTELVAAMLEETLGIVIRDHDPPLWM